MNMEHVNFGPKVNKGTEKAETSETPTEGFNLLKTKMGVDLSVATVLQPLLTKMNLDITDPGIQYGLTRDEAIQIITLTRKNSEKTPEERASDNVKIQNILLDSINRDIAQAA